MGDLTEHFSRSEFACKCNCGADGISEELVSKLELVRLIKENFEVSEWLIGDSDITRADLLNQDKL